MVHTNPEFENFEFDQHLESRKHVINIIMWFRDMGCYSGDGRTCRVLDGRAVERSGGVVCGLHLARGD
jgi:hypothetical protein